MDRRIVSQFIFETKLLYTKNENTIYPIILAAR
jgi:hypothetical protein